MKIQSPLSYLSLIVSISLVIALAYPENDQSFSAINPIEQSGDIFLEVSSIIQTMPGEYVNNYAPPTPKQRTEWNAMLTQLFNANYNQAAMEAVALGYQIIDFTDTTLTTPGNYYMLKTAMESTNYWGTYILNTNPCRPDLVIQAPHPKKDFNVGKQGIHVFKETGAFLYFLSGTDRCNRIDFSLCSGRTKVCSPIDSLESFRISDVAHVTNAIFHTTTEYVAATFPNTTFIQLHGFIKEPTDPYLVLSNGTRETPAVDPILPLAQALHEIDTCLNYKIGHIDLEWDRLLGFTNTQGRHINGQVDACSSNAVSTTGRFIHLEQEKNKLRQDINGWNKIVLALTNVFPVFGNCQACLPPNPAGFNVNNCGSPVVVSWGSVGAAVQYQFYGRRAGGNMLPELNRTVINPGFNVPGSVPNEFQVKIQLRTKCEEEIWSIWTSLIPYTISCE